MVYDRRKWLRSSTPVSDDPRRVPVPPGKQDDEATLLLRGGRVFDAVDGEVREGTVVVSGRKIEDVDYTGDPGLSPQEQVHVIDVPGCTIMPGLIDLHTHLTYHEPEVPVERAQCTADATLRAVERMRFFLESGITSVRDAGSHGNVPFRLKDWVAQGRLPGPRVFPAGRLITGTGGHGAEGLGTASPGRGKIREASGPDDWREAVREQFKLGADVIKVASHFSEEEIHAAVDEAHTLGLRVMCDAETFYIDWAVRAGVDVIEHPLPRSDEAVELMSCSGTAAVPTLIAYMIIFHQHGGYFHSTSRRFSFSGEENMDVVRRMRRVGVKMGVGTDLVMDWFRMLPSAYITELEQFVRAGFTRTEALQAATRISADILDMGHLLGTIEPGKLADLVVVRGAPDCDLRDLGKIDVVIHDGRIVIRNGDLQVPRHEGKEMDDLKN